MRHLWLAAYTDILESLRAWADEGMTIVLVTHGLDLAARFADRLAG